MNNYETRDLTRHVAGTIRSLMAKHGVSQGQLAEAVGVSQSQLSKMTRGAKPISIDQLHAMCWALGADIVDVLKEAQDFLYDYDFQVPSRMYFVREGLRLSEPVALRQDASEPLIPVVEGRKRPAPSADVSSSNDDGEMRSQEDYVRAAFDGKKIKRRKDDSEFFE